MKHGCCMPPAMFLPKTADGGELSAYEALKYSLKVFREMGYDYLETHMSPVMELSEEQLTLAKSDGLTVNSYNCFFPSSLQILSLSDEVFEHANEAIRRAALLGGRCIVFGSGGARRIPEGMSVDDGMNRLKIFITELDKICDKYDMLIAIEPLCTKTTVLRSVGETVDLLEAIKPKNVYALADVYHMYVVNEDLNVLERAAKYLRHIHICEPTDRGYPGWQKTEYLMEFARMLHKIGYNGDVTAECEFNDFAAEAPLGAQFMKEYFN